MRASRPREDRRSGADDVLLAIERQLPLPAQHVVNLVLFLLVLSDSGARMQGTLAKDEREVARGLEERIADRLTASIVRARLALRDQRVVLDQRSVSGARGRARAA